MTTVLPTPRSTDILPWPGFIGSVLDGLDNHPSKRLRRRARGLLHEAEKEIGVDFGVVKGGLRTGQREINEAEALHAALFLLGAGGSPGSDLEARRYGLTDGDATGRALIRLKDRGMVSRRDGRWHIVDPLLAEWLKRQDPLGSGHGLLRRGTD